MLPTADDNRRLVPVELNNFNRGERERIEVLLQLTGDLTQRLVGTSCPTSRPSSATPNRTRPPSELRNPLIVLPASRIDPAPSLNSWL